MNSNVKIEEPSTSFVNFEVKRENDAGPSCTNEKENTVCIWSEVKVKNKINEDESVSCSNQKDYENNTNSYSEIRLQNEPADNFMDENAVEIENERNEEGNVSCSNQKENENSTNSYSEIRVRNEPDTFMTENVISSSQNKMVNSYSETRTKNEKDFTPTSESENQVEQYDFSLENLPTEYKETYDSYIREVKTMASTTIVNSVSREFIENFRHFNRRYYEDKYCINFNTNDPGYCDILIRIHTNKLFLIALASGNDIIQNNRDVLYINFVINNNDRSNIQLRGKRKKGSKAVEPQTILCQIKCKNDSRVYNIRAGVYGRLFEINEHIKTDPNLVRLDPKGMGFIAVLTPRGNPSEYEEQIMKLGLLSEEEYFKYLKQRS